MKFFKYIKWQWNKFEFWQKTFVFAMAAMTSSWLVENENVKLTLIGFGCGVFFFWASKWFVWDMAVESYRKFREEEQTLFQTIKDSHKK